MEINKPPSCYTPCTQTTAVNDSVCLYLALVINITAPHRVWRGYCSIFLPFHWFYLDAKHCCGSLHASQNFVESVSENGGLSKKSHLCEHVALAAARELKSGAAFNSKGKMNSAVVLDGQSVSQLFP